MNRKLLSKMISLLVFIQMITTSNVVMAETSSVEENDWTLIWNDEFSDETINADNWAYELGYVRNNEPQEYTDSPENSYIEDGNLVLQANRDENGHYTSADLTTQNKFDVKYGRIEMRAKLPSGQAIWPAFWTLGSNISTKGWPVCGEIDIMEMWGGTGISHGGNGRTYSTAHWGEENEHASSGDHFYELPDSEKLSEAYHIYAVEWSSTQIKWFFDDINYYTFDITSPDQIAAFNNPQYILLNLAVSPYSGDASINTYPQKYSIDYVRVYQKEGESNGQVLNAGIEEGSNYWLGDATISNDASEGTKSIEVVAGGSAKQVITGLHPNTIYKLKADVKVSGGGVARLGVEQVGVGGLIDDVSSESGNYAQLTSTFVTGANSNSAIIYLSNSAESGTVNGDKFQLSMGDSAITPSFTGLINGDFETGSMDPMSSYNSEATVVGQDAYSGDYSVHIPSLPEGGTSVQYDVTGLQPNTTYTFSAMVKQISDASWGGGCAFGAKNFDSSTSTPVETFTNLSDYASYKMASVSFTTGAMDTSAALYCWGGGGAEAYIDDFSLSVTPVYQELDIENRGFESGSMEPMSSYNGEATVVEQDAYSGNYSVHIPSLPEGGTSVQYDVTGLQPNTTYTFSAMVKQISDASWGGGCAFGAKNFDSSTSTPVETFTNLSDYASYKKASLTFTTGAMDTSAALYCWGGGGAEAYIDDFSLFGPAPAAAEADEFKLEQENIVAVHDSILSLTVKREGSAISKSGNYQVTLPEGWTLQGSANFNAGDETDTLLINVPNNLDYLRSAIRVRAISGLNTECDIVALVKIVSIIGIQKPIGTVLEDNSSEKWGVETYIVNNSSSTSMSGLISLIEPENLARDVAPVFFADIAPYGSAKVTIPLPGLPSSDAIDMKFRVLLDNGYSEEFTQSVNALLAGNTIIKPTMDGIIGTTEWKNATSFDLNTLEQTAGSINNYDSAIFNGAGQIMWDNENVYIAVKVKDQVHYQPFTNSGIWQADSIQIAFDSERGTGVTGAGHYEYGYALSDNGIQKWRWLAAYGRSTSASGDTTCNIIRNEDEKMTTYEIAIPLKDLLAENKQLSKNNLLGFSLLINNADEAARGFLQYNGGIAQDKDTQKQASLILATLNQIPNINTGGGTSDGTSHVPPATGLEQVIVTSYTINEAYAKALAEFEKKQKDLVSSGTVLNRVLAQNMVLNIPAKADIKEVGITLNTADIREAESKGIEAIVLESSIAKIEFNMESFLDIHQNGEKIDFSMKKVELAGLDNVPEGAIVVDFTLKIDDQKVSDFRQPIKISIPYVKKAGENPDEVTVYFLQEDGSIVSVGGIYNEASGLIEFKTSHFSKYFAANVKRTFTDINANFWAAKYISALAGKGVINGRQNDKFDPDANITRAEFVAMISRSLSLVYDGTGLTFNDIPSGAWYADEIEAAYDVKIISGQTATQFSPNVLISRQEAAIVMSNVLGYLRYKTEENSSIIDKEFIDSNQISIWAKNAVATAFREQIITGKPGSIYDATGNTTRAEAAKMIYALYLLQ